MNETLQKARARLVIDQPFFASILLGMPMTEDKKIPTMATNGREIWYNPDFIAKQSLGQTLFILAHEVLHVVFYHMVRRGNRTPMRWNIAADYVINDILVRANIGEKPDGVLYNQALVQKAKGTTEGVYDLLPEDLEQKVKHGGAGSPLEEMQDAAGDAAGLAEQEAEMRVKIAQAAAVAKMMGKVPGGLERVLGKALRSKVDWRSVLRRFLSERAKVDLTYARPKRRFLAEDINLPSLQGERMGGIVFAVDCSGSVDEKLGSKFAAEMSAIKDDVMPANMSVLYFDAKVLRQQDFGPEDTLEVKPCGGGGTAFSPIFKYIEEKGLEPAACVVLTDLCCDDYGKAPGYPVMWASVMEGKVPFGEVLLIED